MKDLDFVLLAFFIFLNAFALLAFFLSKKSKNQVKYGKLNKFCPCEKILGSVNLSTICIYLAIGGFFYSVLSIALIGFKNYAINLIFLMSILSAFLGWKLKLD